MLPPWSRKTGPSAARVSVLRADDPPVIRTGLNESIGRRALVSVQSSISLGEHSEPEPDIAVLRARDGYYAALPGAPDVLLLIEVADSTLTHDLLTKARLHARHGVGHYWVVDLDGRRLHQHRLPVGDTYSEVTARLEPGVWVVPGLDGVSVELGSLFQPP
jgi:Uma2 family endonuclease